MSGFLDRMAARLESARDSAQHALAEQDRLLEELLRVQRSLVGPRPRR